MFCLMPLYGPANTLVNDSPTSFPLAKQNLARLKQCRTQTPALLSGRLLPNRAKKRPLPKGKLLLSAASARLSSTKSVKTPHSAALALLRPVRHGGVAAKASLVLGASAVDANLQLPHQRRMSTLLHLRGRASPNLLVVLYDQRRRRPLYRPRYCPHLAPWRKTMTTMRHHKSVSKIKLQPHHRLSLAHRATAQESFPCRTPFRPGPIAPNLY